jgi:hypothetical protein
MKSMGCVKASEPSKAKISCEYHDILFLTEMEMQTYSTKQRSVVGHKKEGKTTKITSFCTKSSAAP